MVTPKRQNYKKGDQNPSAIPLLAPYLLEKPVEDFFNMLRTIPQNMLEDKHVDLLNLHSAVTVSRHLEQLYRLSHATIGDGHLGLECHLCRESINIVSDALTSSSCLRPACGGCYIHSLDSIEVLFQPLYPKLQDSLSTHNT